MITLIALSLVAGVLVDDAIVEIENIVRHMRMGKKPYEAALEAADEIGLAVVATSATIIAVFLPVSFMSGTTGQFFKEFGLTVALAVFFSLVVARLITPMMAAFFLKDTHHEEKADVLLDTYRAVLGWAIRRPGAAAGMGLSIFVASLVMATQVPFTFIPRFDNGSVQMQRGYSAGHAAARSRPHGAADGREPARKFPRWKGVFTRIRATNGAANEGTIYALLRPREDRQRTAYQVQQTLRPLLAEFPDYRTSFLQLSGRQSRRRHYSAIRGARSRGGERHCRQARERDAWHGHAGRRALFRGEAIAGDPDASTHR